MGYQQNGVQILEPEYEDVIKVGTQRLIVKKGGKKGLLELTKNGIKVICEPIFQDIKHVSGQTFSVLLDDGERAPFTEGTLKNITAMYGGFLVRKTEGNYVVLMYHNKTVSKFQEVRHLIGLFFIVKEHLRYGIIWCVGNEYEYFRRCDYKKIELSEDRRYVLLYKEGRPRFIPIFDLK